MQLVQDQTTPNYIKQVSLSSVQVSEHIYTASSIVMPHQIISPWTSKKFSELNTENFHSIELAKIALVLLGVGERGEKLSPELYYGLLGKKIVIECMSLAAACRTYNILSSERRSVALALLF